MAKTISKASTVHVVEGIFEDSTVRVVSEDQGLAAQAQSLLNTQTVKGEAALTVLATNILDLEGVFSVNASKGLALSNGVGSEQLSAALQAGGQQLE